MSSSSLEDKLKAIAAARRGAHPPHPVAQVIRPKRRGELVAAADTSAYVELVKKKHPREETAVLLGDSDWEREEVVELQRRTDAALEASKVLELKGLPPKEEVKPKRKRGRPRKKKVDVVVSVTPAFEAPEAKVKKTKVSVFIGVGPTARKGEFISMEDAFLAVVGNKQAFYKDKAFDRRDLLVEGVDNWGETLSKSVSVITSHPMTWGPDQKAFVWALRLRAAETGGVIVEGSL